MTTLLKTTRASLVMNLRAVLLTQDSGENLSSHKLSRLAPAKLRLRRQSTCVAHAFLVGA